MPSDSKKFIIDALMECGPTSRSELAENTGLSKAALTELSRDLIAAGLVHELPEAVTARKGKGRPSVRLSVNAGYGLFLGVSVTDERQLMVLSDLRGDVHGEHVGPSVRTPEALVQAVVKGLGQLTRGRRAGSGRVLGIGLAISGFVDHRRGVCVHSANLDWHDVPIASLVTSASGLPTSLENDANAVATGEKLFGLARESRNFTIITVASSVGCAHYMNGRLYRGHHSGAGEIAHCTVEPDGLPCRCGKRGCLDTIASRAAMSEAARVAGLDVGGVHDLETLAARGNGRAASILRRAGQALGFAIASIVQINNPELVLIADTEGFSQGLFLTTARHTVENNILPRFLRGTSIQVHQVSSDFWARGAASIAAQEFITQYASS